MSRLSSIYFFPLHMCAKMSLFVDWENIMYAPILGWVYVFFPTVLNPMTQCTCTFQKDRVLNLLHENHLLKLDWFGFHASV